MLRRMIKSFIMMQLTISLVKCTVDIDLPEMKYLADHLKSEECRRLVAALHFKSYDKPNALDSAEDKISEDLPCLNLLLHWNSSEGEGKGETHEILYRRLRQIGRDDLAEWISKTVFHELGTDLHHALADPFPNLHEKLDEECKTKSSVQDEFPEDKLESLKTKKHQSKAKTDKDEFPGDKIVSPKTKHVDNNNDPFPEDVDDDFPFQKSLSKKGRVEPTIFPEPEQEDIRVEWLPIDTICWVVILLLVLLTIFILYRAIKASRKDRTNGNGNKPQNSKNGKYQKMNQSDSEYEYDRKNVDDPAMKLMGVKSQS